MTPVELKKKGCQILIKELGKLDTIRFLQEMGWGNGDYTQERQEILQGISRADFWRDIEEMRKEKP